MPQWCLFALHMYFKIYTVTLTIFNNYLQVIITEPKNYVVILLLHLLFLCFECFSRRGN